MVVVGFSTLPLLWFQSQLWPMGGFSSNKSRCGKWKWSELVECTMGKWKCAVLRKCAMLLQFSFVPFNIQALYNC